GPNLHKFKLRIQQTIWSQQLGRTARITLCRLVHRLNYKIRGPKPEEIEKLNQLGLTNHPHRRSWIGFFRIVTDENQIRKLNRWIRKQIYLFIWQQHKVQVQFKTLRTVGLISLINMMYRARRPLRPSPRAGNGPQNPTT